MVQIDKLRAVSMASLTLEEAVAVLATHKAIRKEFEDQRIPAPEWLGEQIVDLQREVAVKRVDYLQHQLRKARLKADSLKTRDERRADANAEIARLEKELGIQPEISTQ